MRAGNVAFWPLAARTRPREEKRPKGEEAPFFAGYLEGLLQVANNGKGKEPEAAASDVRQTSPVATATAARPGDGERVPESGGKELPGEETPRVGSNPNIVLQAIDGNASAANGAIAAAVTSQNMGTVQTPGGITVQAFTLITTPGENGAGYMAPDNLVGNGEGMGPEQVSPRPSGQVTAGGYPAWSLPVGEVRESLSPEPPTSSALQVAKEYPRVNVTNVPEGSESQTLPNGSSLPQALWTPEGSSSTGIREIRSTELRVEATAGATGRKASVGDTVAGSKGRLVVLTALPVGEKLPDFSAMTAGQTEGTARLENLKELAARILSLARLENRDGRQELELQLRPEGLGKVRLHTVLADNRLSVQMLVETREAGRILQMSLPELRQVLQSQGLQLDQLQVQVDQGYGGRQQEYRGREEKSLADRGIPKGSDAGPLDLVTLGTGFLDYFA
ncbi:MAG: flagellar hook-length control protein FliK [Moorellaceae bacterium]